MITWTNFCQPRNSNINKSKQQIENTSYRKVALFTEIFGNYCYHTNRQCINFKWTDYLNFLRFLSLFFCLQTELFVVVIFIIRNNYGCFCLVYFCFKLKQKLRFVFVIISFSFYRIPTSMFFCFTVRYEKFAHLPNKNKKKKQLDQSHNKKNCIFFLYTYYNV
jgi:hypothetical protein